ncbi:MAG: type II toxin-antitoxin system HicB family antitoxin [Chloroflexi bacterium]|nr:type II toxin-antitoxin system HicB family antitoxin [Gemmatimonadota bacterium]MBA4170857.1 type II toxin-antitoxin system HicB family antitoxin [Chloroflexota bacterium]
MDHADLHRYSRHVYFDEEDGGFVALCTEFPHLSAFGDTREVALDELEVVLGGAVEVFREEGWPLPEPATAPEPEALPSGKFQVRLPRSLHGQLAARAKQEGVSQNTLVIALVAAGLAGHPMHPAESGVVSSGR